MHYFKYSIAKLSNVDIWGSSERYLKRCFSMKLAMEARTLINIHELVLSIHTYVPTRP